MLCTVCLRFVLFLSLNDDGESNVLEVIQNLELLLYLRETLRIMFLCCGWTGCCWTWFELACTCLEFCFLEKHGTWCCEWFCIRSMVVWVVMACDENLWRNSEGIWVSENFQEGWCHWHSNMLLSWHNRELTHEVLRFRDHQNGSDVKRGIDSDFAMMKRWELFYKNVFHRFLIPCRS